MTRTHIDPDQAFSTMKEPIVDGRHDFSLVLGGPIFQLFCKSHLSEDTLDLLHRRLPIITGAKGGFQ
ncbi:MAG: hypothetical protein WBX22_00920 [Silvibacterium sp.]